MRARDIGAALLKIWGVILLVRGVLTLVSLLPMAFSPMDENLQFALRGNGLNGIVALVAGVALLVSADAILRLIGVGDETEADVLPGRYSAAELQSLVFGGLGVYFAIGALRDIATLVYTILRKPEWDSTNAMPYLFQHAQNDLVGAAVQLIAAIILLVNRRMLATAWHRMRPMASQHDGE